MDETKAKKIFSEHFIDNGPLSVFYTSSENRSEKDRIFSRGYMHESGDFKIECIILNGQVESILYTDAQYFNLAPGDQKRNAEYLDSITFNSKGTKKRRKRKGTD